MPGSLSALTPQGQAFNRTRQRPLATELAVADTHWTRLRGLLGLNADEFLPGSGLWILPCHGVHSLGMRFEIDVVYLDSNRTVVYVQSGLKPWRVAPVRGKATSVLELPCGMAVETGTEVGDKIEINIGKEFVQSRSMPMSLGNMSSGETTSRHMGSRAGGS
jgi:uncharacterized membrane protein (UPF0127 family)